MNLDSYIEFKRIGRVLTAKTKKKISNSLKKKFGRKAGDMKRAKAKVISSKTNAPPKQPAYKTENLADSMTGATTRKMTKTRQGNAVERVSREGFTGYTPKAKSKQNKYTDNLRKTLRS